MEDLARVERRIGSLTELKSLFSAMQAIAASRVRTAQRSLDAIRKYTGTIEDAIRDAIVLPAVHDHLDPSLGQARSTHVVVCSEHGFVGAFNRLLLVHAKSRFGPLDDLVVVGRRGASVAPEHGLSPTAVVAMSAHIDGILTTARRLASHCEGSETVHVSYAAYRGGNRFEARTRRVLPPPAPVLRSRRAQAPPLHHLEAGLLLRRLVGELLLAELMLVLTESFASENAARLGIMQSADENITEKLGKLKARDRRLRQDAITSELLDIVSGSEVLGRSTL